MRKICLAMLAIIAITLTGCFSETPEDAIEFDQPTPEVSANGSWVQDLWVYGQLQTVTAGGETVDLTDHILAGLETPDRSEPMPNGAIFHIYDSLAPTVTSSGTVRSDLSVVAGVIEMEQVRALAALATPRPDAHGSVGFDDEVELDLTFLGDLLSPGDALVTDLIFLQTRPADDEPRLDDVALLSERLSNGRAFTFGVHTDEGLQMAPLKNVLGEAVSGSTRMSVPGKGGLPYPDITGPAKGLFCPNARCQAVLSHSAYIRVVLCVRWLIPTVLAGDGVTGLHLKRPVCFA